MISCSQSTIFNKSSRAAKLQLKTELLKTIRGLVERKSRYIYLVLGRRLTVFVLIYIYVYRSNLYDSLAWVNDMINLLSYRAPSYAEPTAPVGVLDIFLHYSCHCYTGTYRKHVVLYRDETEVATTALLQPLPVRTGRLRLSDPCWSTSRPCQHVFGQVHGNRKYVFHILRFWLQNILLLFEHLLPHVGLVDCLHVLRKTASRLFSL